MFPRTSFQKVGITQEQAWDWMWPAIGSIGSMKVTLLNLGFHGCWPLVSGSLSHRGSTDLNWGYLSFMLDTFSLHVSPTLYHPLLHGGPAGGGTCLLAFVISCVFCQCAALPKDWEGEKVKAVLLWSPCRLAVPKLSQPLLVFAPYIVLALPAKLLP